MFGGRASLGRHLNSSWFASSSVTSLKLCDVCRPRSQDWHLFSEYECKDVSLTCYLSAEIGKSHSNYFFFLPLSPIPHIHLLFFTSHFHLTQQVRDSADGLCYLKPDLNTNKITKQSWNVRLVCVFVFFFKREKPKTMCFLSFIRTYRKTFTTSRGHSLHGRMMW